MGNEIQFGIRITGNNREAIQAIRETGAEMDKVGTSGGKLASQYSGLTVAQDKTAASARLESAEIKKLDADLTRLLSSIDPVYRSTRQLDSANDLLHRGLREGVLSQQQYQSALKQIENNFGMAATTAEKSAFATAQARRELIVLGHEAISGNFSRMPGSFLVLAERMGGITSLLNPMTIGVTAVGTLLAAGAYAWSKWGDHANEATQRVIDGIEKSKKSLEDLQKEFDKMQRIELGANIDSLELQKSMLQKRQQELLGKDGGLKGTLNIFDPLGPKKEYDDLASKMALIDRQIGLANASMKNLVEGGGKDFRGFMENTSYMDKAQQRLHDLTKAAEEYRAAWLAASDDTQRAAALERFRQAEKNIEEKYRDKKKQTQGPNLYEKEMNDIASLMQEAGKLNEGEQSHIDILQHKLDAYSRLDPAVRVYIQEQLDQAKALEDAANWEKVFNDSIEREIEAANAAAQAEEAAARARDNAFADLSARLQTENEDLNIALIASDKQRAKAQLDLEHQRALDRINGMILESAKAQQLIEEENANYDLRIKKLDETKSVAHDLGLTFSSAFEDAITGGKKFSDVLAGLAQDIERLLVRRTITDPLTRGVDAWISSLDIGSWFAPNAAGGVYAGAGISAYSGQVVSRPTLFPFARGIGLMGEAGPEAILPLSRGSDGKLGVKASGGSTVVHVSVAVDASGSKVQGDQQGGAELGRRIAGAVRSVLLEEKRPGGLLAA